MCHLLTDPSVDVQKMTFQLLQQAARKRTEYLVIEAGVDSDDNFQADLPEELLLILQATFDQAEWVQQEGVRLLYSVPFEA